MATISQLTLKVSIAWWIYPYLHGVSMMSQLTGLEPNPERVAYWAGKAMKTEVVVAKPNA